MLTVKKLFKFEASHRLLGHPNKCANVHGHNYKVWVSIYSLDGSLDELGMVMDFSDMKATIGKWLDDNWDHSIMINRDDVYLLQKFEKSDFKTYICNFNPTAENMAIFLLAHFRELMKQYNIGVKSIEVYENDESFAIADWDVDDDV